MSKKEYHFCGGPDRHEGSFNSLLSGERFPFFVQKGKDVKMIQIGIKMETIHINNANEIRFAGNYIQEGKKGRPFPIRAEYHFIRKNNPVKIILQ
jgi:hypothetical protein